MDGYIKLHRKILENPIVCKDAEYFSIWLYLLLNATHKEFPAIFNGEKIILQPGQLITGRYSIANQFGISESKVKRVLINLETDQQIDRQRSNKNSLITILNWNTYQQRDQQDDQPVTDKRPTSDQQVTTNKNVKNVKNEININTYSEIVDLYNQICSSFPQCTKLSEARKKAISARLKIYSVDDFKTMFQLAEQSNFLKGKNDRNWSANFDWLIKDTNMAKVLDGNYKNKGDEKQSGQPRIQTTRDNALDCTKAFAERFGDQPINEEMPFM